MRRFVYLYNQREQDVEDDGAETVEMPGVGSVISRRDKNWRVIRVIAPVLLNGTIPVVRVFLNDIARSVERSRVKFLPK